MGLGLVWETFSCEVATPIMGTRDDPLWHTTYTENILNWSNRNTALLQLGFCPNNYIDFFICKTNMAIWPIYGCYTHILNSIRKGYWEPLAVVSYRGARGYIWYRPLHKNCNQTTTHGFNVFQMNPSQWQTKKHKNIFKIACNRKSTPVWLAEDRE